MSSLGLWNVQIMLKKKLYIMNSLKHPRLSGRHLKKPTFFGLAIFFLFHRCKTYLKKKKKDCQINLLPFLRAGGHSSNTKYQIRDILSDIFTSFIKLINKWHTYITKQHHYQSRGKKKRLHKIIPFKVSKSNWRFKESAWKNWP